MALFPVPLPTFSLVSFIDCVFVFLKLTCTFSSPSCLSFFSHSCAPKTVLFLRARSVCPYPPHCLLKYLIGQVRMQAESMSQPNASLRRYTSFSGTFRTILAEEGAWSLLSAGVVSACYRDLLYSGIRYSKRSAAQKNERHRRGKKSFECKLIWNRNCSV